MSELRGISRHARWGAEHVDIYRERHSLTFRSQFGASVLCTIDSDARRCHPPAADDGGAEPPHIVPLRCSRRRFLVRLRPGAQRGTQDDRWWRVALAATQRLELPVSSPSGSPASAAEAAAGNQITLTGGACRHRPGSGHRSGSSGRRRNSLYQAARRRMVARLLLVPRKRVHGAPPVAGPVSPYARCRGRERLTFVYFDSRAPSRVTRVGSPHRRHRSVRKAAYTSTLRTSATAGTKIRSAFSNRRP